MPTRKMFFMAHIQPHFDYASTIWDGCSEANFKRINSLHRRAVRLVSENNSLTTDAKIRSLNLLPLKKSLQINKGVLMQKIMASKAPDYLQKLFRRPTASRRSARNRASLVVPWPRLDLFKNSLSYSGSKLWNSLPSEITSAPSVTSFRARLHKHLRAT